MKKSYGVDIEKYQSQYAPIKKFESQVNTKKFNF